MIEHDTEHVAISTAGPSPAEVRALLKERCFTTAFDDKDVPLFMGRVGISYRHGVVAISENSEKHRDSGNFTLGTQEYEFLRTTDARLLLESTGYAKAVRVRDLEGIPLGTYLLFRKDEAEKQSEDFEL